MNLQAQTLPLGRHPGLVRPSPANGAAARNTASLGVLVATLALVAAAPAAWTYPAAAAPAAPAPALSAAPAAVAKKVVEVRMVSTPDGASGRFEPAGVTARRGDIVRFITDGRTVHNVSFPPSENPGKRHLPPPGPYVTAPGQSYDVVVELGRGTYHFQCDPHATMRMKGTLTVR